MINRWRYFSYEKQRHLHVSENLLKEDQHTDMADLDFRFIKHLLRAHLIPVFSTTITCLASACGPGSTPPGLNIS